jgi:hypothetical protein
VLAQRLGSHVQVLVDTTAALEAGLQRAGAAVEEEGETLTIEVDGQVVVRAPTDDAVRRFVIEQWGPLLDPNAADHEAMLGKSLDRFRFLRAYSRTARLHAMLQAARAALLAGPQGRATYERFYQAASRGLVLSQEPGLLQGPAVLGGVYSGPSLLVEWLELTLDAPNAPVLAEVMVQQGGRSTVLPWGRPLEVSSAAVVQVPAGAVVRVDRPAQLSLTDGPPAP